MPIHIKIMLAHPTESDGIHRQANVTLRADFGATRSKHLMCLNVNEFLFFLFTRFEAIIIKKES